MNRPTCPPPSRPSTPQPPADRPAECPAPTPPAPHRGNTHWRNWEIGCLIDGRVAGRSCEAIGASLGRSPLACERMWKRLLDGETPCPAEHRDALDAARRNLDARKPDRRGDSPAAAKHDDALGLDAAIREFLEAVVTNGRITANRLESLERLMVYSLAVDLIEKRTCPDEVRDVCPDVADRAIRLASAVASYRQRVRGLADGHCEACFGTGLQLFRIAGATRPDGRRTFTTNRLPCAVCNGTGRGASKAEPVRPTPGIYTQDGHALGHTDDLDDLDELDTPGGLDAALDAMIDEAEALDGLGNGEPTTGNRA